MLRIQKIFLTVAIFLFVLGFVIAILGDSHLIKLSVVSSGGLSSLIVALALVIAGWRLFPEWYNGIVDERNEKRSDSERQEHLPSLQEYLGEHPYVAILVIGLMVAEFLSIWTAIRVYGELFFYLLSSDVSFVKVIVTTVNSASLILLGYLFYSLIAVVKASESGDKIYVIL